MLQRVRGRSWLRRMRKHCETGTVSALLALTNFGPTALENKRPCQSSTGSIPRGEAVNVFSGKSLKEATVARASAQVDGVHLCVSKARETRSTLHSAYDWVLVLGFVPTALAAAPAMARVHTIRPGCAPAVYFRRGIHGRTPTCTLGKNWISSRPASNRTALPSRQC